MLVAIASMVVVASCGGWCAAAAAAEARRVVGTLAVSGGMQANNCGMGIQLQSCKDGKGEKSCYVVRVNKR